MANEPLSPRSESSLNHVISSFSNLKTVLQSSSSQEANFDVVHNATPSKQEDLGIPFDLDVDFTTQDIPESAKPRRSARRPSLLAKSSPSKTFTIHEDDEHKMTNNVGGDPGKSGLGKSSDATTETKLVAAEELDANVVRPTSEISATNKTDMDGVDTTITLSCITPVPTHHLERNFEAEADDDDVKSTVSEDTCFSTFSAVPNANTIAFAGPANPSLTQLQRSPFKLGAIDEVSRSWRS